MTIYIDADYKCHAGNGDGLTAVDVPYFDGRDASFIEAYRFVPAGCIWVREDGVAFRGEMLAPYKTVPSSVITVSEYEQMRKEIEDMRAALAELGVTVDE